MWFKWYLTCKCFFFFVVFWEKKLRKKTNLEKSLTVVKWEIKFERRKKNTHTYNRNQVILRVKLLISWTENSTIDTLFLINDSSPPTFFSFQTRKRERKRVSVCVCVGTKVTKKRGNKSKRKSKYVCKKYSFEIE